MRNILSKQIKLYTYVISWGLFIIIWAIIVLASISWRYFKSVPINLPTAEFIFTVDNGAGISKVAQQLAQLGIIPNAKVFRWLAICQGQAQQLKAGEYLLTRTMTQDRVLKQLISGEVIQYYFTLVDGWNLQQILAALRQAPKLKFIADNDQLFIAELIAALETEKRINNPEGLFWPETYAYTADSSAINILKQANKLLQQKVQIFWQERTVNCKLTSKYEAIILASIIEKETKLPTEHAAIAGVYQQRLQKKMRLQADPTVIYAWLQRGEVKSPLTKSDLTIDSPYNTYKNHGLPPTPIAIAGEKALYAAMHPAADNKLYFVAKGDGSHIFSSTLLEHNKAVKAIFFKSN